MRQEATGAGPCVLAYICMAAGVGLASYFAQLRYIRIDWSFGFAEAFMQRMDWTWAAGGFLIAVVGCIAGEKARNSGVGLIATVAVTGCLLLTLSYAMILFYSVGGFTQFLDWLR